MTSVGRSGADSSPLLLQDIAAPMLARDLYDLCPAQRSGAHSPRLPGVSRGYAWTEAWPMTWK